MSKIIFFVLMVLMSGLVACASFQNPRSSSEESFAKSRTPNLAGLDDMSAFATAGLGPQAPLTMAEAEMERSAFGLQPRAIAGDSNVDIQALQTAERKVISTASISMEVEAVEFVTKQVQSVIEGMGGFVESLSISGRPKNQQASMTLRVPQSQFSAAVDAIDDLGEVQNKNLGSEDVAERFIDLEARIKSSISEEESLLALLERTRTVSEILIIERELSRVRSDIERVQGQLNFLERQVDLATIDLSLFQPKGTGRTPPSASLGIEVSQVSKEVDDIKAFMSSIDGSIDGVFLSINNGQERAEISLRVFTQDFNRTVDFLENAGDVKTKELTEGKTGSDDEGTADKDPNARIGISLVTNPGVSWMEIIWTSFGIVLLTLVVVIPLLKVFRWARSRREVKIS